ncbi:MAG: AI-2E family transporter, partial [Vicinamibacteria bacterium]
MPIANQPSAAETQPRASGLPSHLFERPVRVLTFGILGLLLLASFYTLYFARDFFLPIVVALLISFPLAPVVRALSKLKIPESIGAALVLVGFLAALGYTGSHVYGPAADWMSRLPGELKTIRERLRDLRGSVAEVSSAAKELEEQVEQFTATEPTTEERRRAVLMERPPLSEGLFTRTSRILTSTVLTLVLLYFLLASGDFFVLKAVRVLPRL